MTAIKQNVARPGKYRVITMNELIERYRDAWVALTVAKAKEFPRGSIIWVDCPQYRGPGKVAIADGCPVDKLPVLLENGDVWWYPLAACSRAERQACSKEAK